MGCQVASLHTLIASNSYIDNNWRYVCVLVQWRAGANCLGVVWDHTSKKKSVGTSATAANICVNAPMLPDLLAQNILKDKTAYGQYVGGILEDFFNHF